MGTVLNETLAASIEEPLDRLIAFEPSPLPVISVYLNTQPDQHGRDPEIIPYLQREFKALARTGRPARRSARASMPTSSVSLLTQRTISGRRPMESRFSLAMARVDSSRRSSSALR